MKAKAKTMKVVRGGKRYEVVPRDTYREVYVSVTDAGDALQVQQDGYSVYVDKSRVLAFVLAVLTAANSDAKVSK